MKLDKFKKLEKRFANNTFESMYYYTMLVLHYASYLGNIFGIIFSYFFVQHLTSQAAVHFSGQEIILPIFIVLFLTGFELTKRFTFANVVSTYLTAKQISGKFIAGSAFVFLLVAVTFYLSINGAKQYANREDTIIVNADSTINNQLDSLDKYFKIESQKVENKINYLYNAAKTQNERSLYKREVSQVSRWEEALADLKTEHSDKTSKVKEVIKTKVSRETNKSHASQYAFLFISSFIELLILIGVFFKQYYDYISFKEAKEYFESNPSFRKLIAYQELLRILYANGKMKANSDLPTFNKFKELVSSTSKQHTQTTLREFLALMNYLKVSQIIGGSRMALVGFEKANEILDSYLVIDDNGR